MDARHVTTNPHIYQALRQVASHVRRYSIAGAVAIEAAACGKPHTWQDPGGAAASIAWLAVARGTVDAGGRLTVIGTAQDYKFVMDLAEASATPGPQNCTRLGDGGTQTDLQAEARGDRGAAQSPQQHEDGYAHRYQQ